MIEEIVGEGREVVNFFCFIYFCKRLICDFAMI